jgi:transposase-like protein
MKTVEQKAQEVFNALNPELRCFFCRDGKVWRVLTVKNATGEPRWTCHACLRGFLRSRWAMQHMDYAPGSDKAVADCFRAYVNEHDDPI